GVTVRAAATEPCTVMGEEALLESLVVNLADNAAKACDPGGHVMLAVRKGPGGRGAVLLVRDDGRGMDADTLARLGDPFFRPDKARSRAQGGAGLGLTLCFQIAQSHGAKLQFASEPGKGTAATVSFP
ncbi:MAG: ATP-binding protein, partial [Muribaculaceae bacterium]|nr:ATP-binding protein [Muribaculaceae bacterium]